MLLINRLMRRRKEGGAALVEFAVMAPFLILLLMGIIEFGYKFGQYNEIRHAARETARYAAVSNPDRDGTPPVTNADVLKVCDNAFNLPSTQSYVQVVILDTSVTPNVPKAAGTVGQPGDTARTTVTAIVPSLTGMPIISNFLPKILTSTVELRIEQTTGWTSFTPAAFTPPPAAPNWPPC